MEKLFLLDAYALIYRSYYAFIKNPKRVTNDPMEAHYIGFNMWLQAVAQAGSTDVDAVRQAMYGQKVKNLTGGVEGPTRDFPNRPPIGQLDDLGFRQEAVSLKWTVPGDFANADKTGAGLLGERKDGLVRSLALKQRPFFDG